MAEKDKKPSDQNEIDALKKQVERLERAVEMLITTAAEGNSEAQGIVSSDDW